VRVALVDGATIVVGVCAMTVTAFVLWQHTLGGASGESEDRRIEAMEDYVRDGRRLGHREAPVAILEWGDYECPFCRRFEAVLEGIRERYPDHVAVIYRHWPLGYHERAFDAAVGAECAALQDRFPEYHAALYQSTDWLDSNDLESALVELAEREEVPDLSAFETCLAEERPRERIEADIAAVRELGGRGTPTVVVNGILLGAVPDSATLDRMVQEAIKETPGTLQ